MPVSWGMAMPGERLRYRDRSFVRSVRERAERQPRQRRIRPPTAAPPAADRPDGSDGPDGTAVVRANHPDSAQRQLARRCLVEPHEFAPQELDEFFSAERLAQLGQRLTELHPQAETRLDFTCPECGKAWSDPADVADFLWTELSAKARQLLLEVDALARAYGWNEAEVLALSPARRTAYLRLATS